MTDSTQQITIGTTLAGSVAATLVIALKGAPGWFWWVFIISIAGALLLWIWVFTRYSLSKDGWLALPLRWWVLGITCSFDAALAFISYLAMHST